MERHRSLQKETLTRGIFRRGALVERAFISLASCDHLTERRDLPFGMRCGRADMIAARSRRLHESTEQARRERRTSGAFDTAITETSRTTTSFDTDDALRNECGCAPVARRTRRAQRPGRPVLARSIVRSKSEACIPRTRDQIHTLDSEGEHAHAEAMLGEFLVSSRDAIITRAREWASLRASPRSNDVDLTNGIPVLLEQVGTAVRLASSSDRVAYQRLVAHAERHEGEPFPAVARIVHDYGDLRQAILDLATRQETPVSADELRTLNLCLDDAMARAVTEYGHRRERAIAEGATERLGAFAHELRNLLNTAMLSFEVIKSGRGATSNSASLVHARSLLGLRDLIDRALADVRLDAGLKRQELISVADLVEELEATALLQAQARGLRLAVTSVDRSLTIEGDRQILAAALSNLLQNAFKFTHDRGSVSLTASATADRVLFDVADECGGLPPGKTEDLFRPFEQRDPTRGGIGLGLTISLKAAVANAGQVRVRDLPGTGCVFTLDLPRKAPPPSSVVDGGNTDREGRATGHLRPLR
jgi:signal transduction histidine kinase